MKWDTCWDTLLWDATPNLGNNNYWFVNPALTMEACRNTVSLIPYYIWLYQYVKDRVSFLCSAYQLRSEVSPLWEVRIVQPD